MYVLFGTSCCYCSFTFMAFMGKRRNCLGFSLVFKCLFCLFTASRPQKMERRRNRCPRRRPAPGSQTTICTKVCRVTNRKTKGARTTKETAHSETQETTQVHREIIHLISLNSLISFNFFRTHVQSINESQVE